jgi:hypothetical protein
VSNRTIYLRVCVVEEIPTRKDVVEETVDGFEIEFADLRDARKVLRAVSDKLEDYEQEDIMDDGSGGDDAEDDEDDDTEELLGKVTSVVKAHVRKKLR